MIANWPRILVAAAVAAIQAGGAAGQPDGMAPMMDARDPTLVIPGQYIVILDDAMAIGHHGTSFLDAHDEWISALVEESNSRRAASRDDGNDVRIEHKYAVEGLLGYSGRFSPDLVEQIRRRPEVKYVEHDQMVYALDMIDGDSRKARLRQALADGSILPTDLFEGPAQGAGKARSGRGRRTTALGSRKAGLPSSSLRDRNLATPRIVKQKDAPWGLSRVSHGEMPSSLRKYNYPKSAGSGVDVYVVDTGINVKHADFGGRAKWGVTIPFGDLDIDGNGHGTHCAGTIASRTYGVAKKANVIAVKVLRTSGFGTNADVIKGVEWVIKAAKRGAAAGRRSAANMSLGGGRSFTLEAVVNKAVKAGVHFAVAAGNDNEDACDYSPAAATRPITVGATNRNDQMTFFSNHGKCVDVFAPGMDITSTWIGGSYATNTISGTSMAAPHVAGVAALYLGERDYEPEDLKELIVSHSSKGLLEDLPAATENRLLCTLPLMVADV